jgi:MFS family permease
MKIRPESVGFLLLLGACTAMPPLSVDMGQPAVTPIARALGSSPAAVAYALSLYMVGFATAPVVFRPIRAATGPADWMHAIRHHGFGLRRGAFDDLLHDLEAA